MDAYFSAAARAEAQRWIGIAGKLLAARDLTGSKSFALRAQESDPNNESAAQILAVVDTLFAGEKRINNQHDLYSILQLPALTHDWEIIAANYRKLALLLNPHMNNFPFADQAFSFVLEAWSVLSNPSRKSVYDNEINFQPTFVPVPVQVTQLEQQLPFNIHQNQQEPQLHVRQNQNPKERVENVVREESELNLNQNELQLHVRQNQNPKERVENVVREGSELNLNQSEPQLHVRQNQNPKERVENVVSEESELNLNQNQNQNHDGSENDDGSSTFWTACPYCYNMYEYPRVYVDCCLLCQNCQRGFQAVKIPTPNVDFDQKGAVFSCFGYFPLAIQNPEKKGGASNWCPFSQLVACPQFGKTDEGQNGKTDEGQSGKSDEDQRKSMGRRRMGPVVYIDDDSEVLHEMSDSGDDDSSDGDWRNSSYKRKKKAKKTKGNVSSGRRGRPPKHMQGRNAENVNGGVGENVGTGGFVVREGAGVSSVTSVERSEPTRKVMGNNLRRQTGRGARNLGKLDLNVELSNEVEDPAQSNGGGRREEDNVEGIGFFEGLDEFLNNLPILSVVGEDKVKAAS